MPILRALGAVAAFACALAPVADAGVTFPGSTGTGITSGQATRLSDNTTIILPEQSGFITASGNSGSGGTGGGIGDGAVSVASLMLTFDASITQNRGPGSPSFRVRASVVGRARFNDPSRYTGRISASVLLDTPLVIELSDPSFYTGTQPLTSTTSGDVFFPNSTLPAGFYTILPRGTNLSLRATDLQPIDTLDIYYEGLFVVPAPGTTSVALLAATIATRRRRR